MKPILISSPTTVDNEHAILSSLFANGLELFHLRKPDFTLKQLEEYIAQIPSEYYDKIVLHSHHSLVDKYNLKGKHLSKISLADNADTRRINNKKETHKTGNTSAEISEISEQEYISTSFHSLDEISNCTNKYEYAFLSPVYDSISKQGYSSKFDKKELKNFFSNYNKNIKIIALGGIDEHNTQQTIELGFDGVAVLGAVWNNSNPVEKFKKVNEQVMLNSIQHL